MAARIIVLDSVNSRWYWPHRYRSILSILQIKKEKDSYDLTPAATTTATPAPKQKDCVSPRIGMVQKVILQFIKKCLNKIN